MISNKADKVLYSERRQNLTSLVKSEGRKRKAEGQEKKRETQEGDNGE